MKVNQMKHLLFYCFKKDKCREWLVALFLYLTHTLKTPVFGRATFQFPVVNVTKHAITS